MAPSPSPTTSQLLSGQSPVPGVVPPPAKSRKLWIVVGGLLLGAAAAGAVVLVSQPKEETGVASAPPPPPKTPTITVEAIDPAPKVEPKQEPPKVEPKQDPPKADGDTLPIEEPKHTAPAMHDRDVHLKVAQELFLKGKNDAALDELLAIDDITGLDVYKVSLAVDKLRRHTTSDKVKLAVALLSLPPIKPAAAAHPVVHKPPAKDPTPPAKDPTPPTKTPCAPSDPKCGL